MDERWKRIARDCWKSRLGRLLFFLHLMFAMALVGYYYNYIYLNVGADIPDVFIQWRKCYLAVNWPQILVVDHYIVSVWKPGMGRFNDGFITLLVSLPWWLYGYAAEELARMIRQRLGVTSER